MKKLFLCITLFSATTALSMDHERKVYKNFKQPAHQAHNVKVEQKRRQVIGAHDLTSKQRKKAPQNPQPLVPGLIPFMVAQAVVIDSLKH